MSLKFLVIDDEALVTQTLVDSIRASGHDAEGYREPNAFLQHLQDKGADVIVVDLVMPQMDGVELIHRALGMAPNIRVILISAFGKRNLAQASRVLMAKGCELDGILEKPFSMKDMERLINGLKT